MNLAKMLNICHYFMNKGVPLHTEINIALYKNNENGLSAELFNLEGLIADAETGKVLICVGDKATAFMYHGIEQEPDKYDSFAIIHDDSVRNGVKLEKIDGNLL